MNVLYRMDDHIVTVLNLDHYFELPLPWVSIHYNALKVLIFFMISFFQVL
jgi:hypothetical protein